MKDSGKGTWVSFVRLKSPPALACLEFLVYWLMLSPPLVTGTADRSSASEDTLKQFLEDYLRPGPGEDNVVRYIDAAKDLNGDGRPEAIVHVRGRAWCGSGGCVTLILTPKDGTYRVVASIPITRPPIRVLNRVSNGWAHIGVWVSGGGITPGYEAELPFDGSTYPKNPSDPRFRRPGEKTPREVVISPRQEEKKLVYPGFQSGVGDP